MAKLPLIIGIICLIGLASINEQLGSVGDPYFAGAIILWVLLCSTSMKEAK